jgi:hypothetical protein
MTLMGSLMRLDKYPKVVNSNSNTLMMEQLKAKDEPTPIFLTNNIKPISRLPTEPSTTGVLSEKRIIVSGKHSMKDWGEYDSQSHMYSRDYYHSQTCLPITYSQLDNDSDDEIDE